MAKVDVHRANFKTQKEFMKAYQKAWYEHNKVRAKQTQRDWYEKNKDKVSQRLAANYEKRKDYLKIYREGRSEKNRDWRLQKAYGITLEEFNQKLEKQGFKCAICGSENHGSRNWHVDHDHNDGEVRGILCNNCNGGLGFFKDDIKILQRALNYLLLP